MSKTRTPLNGSSSGDISVDDLAEQINTIKADLAELSKSLSDYGSAKTHDAAQTAREKVEELHRAGRDKAVEAQLHAEEFILKQPATALGIAAGVGFLVGMFMAPRR